MDSKQVALGLGLLGVGALTFVTPTMVDSSRLVSLFAITTVAIAGSAFLVGTVREGRLD